MAYPHTYNVAMLIFFSEQKPMITELINNISTGFPDVYQGWVSSLPAEIQLKMKQILE